MQWGEVICCPTQYNNNINSKRPPQYRVLPRPINVRLPQSYMHSQSLYFTDWMPICDIHRCQENRIDGHDPLHQTTQPSACDYQRTPATCTFRTFCNSAPSLSRSPLTSAATSTSETTNSCAHGRGWWGRRCRRRRRSGGRRRGRRGRR